MEIKTYDSNGISISPEEAFVVGLAAAENLNNFLIDDSWLVSWKAIFKDRNFGYGTRTWCNLGLRNIYGALYAKYQRFLQGQQNDSVLDIFGYSVLALIYISQLSDYHVDFTPFPQNINDLISYGHRMFWIGNNVDTDIAASFFILVTKLMCEQISCEGKISD